MPNLRVDPILQRRIETMVAAVLPAGTAWGIYDRAVPTPMNLVLNLVEQRLGEPAVLAWIDGGAPDVFTLGRLPVPVAVWSTRYLELCAALRTLLVEAALGRLRRDLARRIALTVLAELALRSGRPGLAAKCLVGAEVDRGLIVPTENLLADLEVAPISEAYLALWFFGLVHEFGHRRPESDFALGPLTDQSIMVGLRQALARMSITRRGWLDPDASLAEVRGRSAHPLQPAHVRGEAQADLFAAEVIIEAAPELMNRVGRGQPAPLELAAELLLATTLISFLERCKGFLSLLPATAADVDRSASALQPAALAVRQLVLRDYLTMALGPETGPPGVFERWRRAIAGIVDHLAGAADDLDAGLAAAFAFVLDEEVPRSVS